MAQEIEKCINCNKAFPKEGKFKQYLLWKEGIENDKACEGCWNQKQEDYKKQEEYKSIWETSWEKEDRDNDSPVRSDGFSQKVIWTSCLETGCKAKFAPNDIEAIRHRMQIGNDDLHNQSLPHEELNKNSKPVNSMEDIVKQWMENMEHRRIYMSGGEYVIVDKEGEEEKDFSAGGYGKGGKARKGSEWKYALVEWLKKQPNQAFELKSKHKESNDDNIERERERERANSTTNTGIGEYNQSKSPAGTRTEWPQREVSQIRKQFRKRSKKNRLDSVDYWGNNVGGSNRSNYLPPC